MGDRTYMQAFIYDCPPESAGPVLDAMSEYFDDGEGHSPTGSDKDTLVLFEQYSVFETSVGNSSELASALQEIPGVAFEVSEDPKYEFLGDVHYYVPGLGYWNANAESGGSPVFTAAEIAEWIDTDLSPEQMLDKLGKPWTTAFATLGAAAMTCFNCGAQMTGRSDNGECFGHEDAEPGSPRFHTPTLDTVRRLDEADIPYDLTDEQVLLGLAESMANASSASPIRATDAEFAAAEKDVRAKIASGAIYTDNSGWHWPQKED